MLCDPEEQADMHAHESGILDNGILYVQFKN